MPRADIGVPGGDQPAVKRACAGQVQRKEVGALLGGAPRQVVAGAFVRGDQAGRASTVVEKKVHELVVVLPGVRCVDRDGRGHSARSSRPGRSHR